MDRRGDTDLMMDNLIYLFIFILFFLTMFYFVNSYSNGGAFYEDFYAKEISRIINSAQPGMELKIDVTPLVVVASKNKKPLNEIILIDNVNNKVIVSSKLNSGTSFSFFNDVDVIYSPLEVISGGVENTRFIFKIVEKQRVEL